MADRSLSYDMCQGMLTTLEKLAKIIRLQMLESNHYSSMEEITNLMEMSSHAILELLKIQLKEKGDADTFKERISQLYNLAGNLSRCNNQILRLNEAHSPEIDRKELLNAVAKMIEPIDHFVSECKNRDWSTLDDENIEGHLNALNQECKSVSKVLLLNIVKATNSP